MTSAYDRWLTTPPDNEPPPQPRCGSCGSYLRVAPDRTEPWEDAYDCDGSSKLVEVEMSPAVLAILGSNAKQYAAVSPCGIDKPGQHEPHHVVMWGGIDRLRVCPRCGRENVERDG